MTPLRSAKTLDTSPRLNLVLYGLLCDVLWFSSALAEPKHTISCESCHPHIMKEWRQSVHARAFTKLPLHERTTLHCRSCHDDAGVRALIKEQMTFRANKAIKYSAQKAIRGVDCLSCHGLTFPQSHNDQSQKRSSMREFAMKSCDRCHSLPPLPRRALRCYNPHDLSKLNEQTCQTLGGKDHRLKTPLTQDTKPQHHSQNK